MEALQWQQAGLLDAGEAEAIALARQLSADWLLTDDTAARLFAQEQGFEVHGSLGVLLWAAEYRLIDKTAAESALEKLAGTSLWLSARVLAHARVLTDEITASS
jgi:predicted nucleic acid-binding protein